MAIKPLWKQSDIKARKDLIQAEIQKRILALLSYTGEQFVSVARQLADFTDQTGNLRSSIGYIILHDGLVVKQDFKISGSGSDGGDGINYGKEHADRLSVEFSKGWVLIGVAGMDYAAAVESKGFEVISTSSLTVKNALEDRLRRIAK